MRIRPRSRPVPMLLAGLILAGLPACQPAADFGVAHAAVPAFGPCASSMDSVRADRGSPWKTIVGDEEDLSQKTMVSDHEWGYLLTDATGEPRGDSAAVVHFRWSRDATWCDVRERRAKRLTGALLPPWSDPAEG